MRKLWLATTIGLGGMMLAMGGGCQSAREEIPRWPIVKGIHNSPPTPVNDTPLIVDGAMEARNWDRSSAYYASGDTIAGNTGFFWEPSWDEPNWFYAVEETPLFIVNTVASPVSLAITPPWKPIRWTGETIEPTYTAMPVLPPAQVAEPLTAPPANVPPEMPANEAAAPSENPPPTTQP